jgi:hypothetical protein
MLRTGTFFWVITAAHLLPRTARAVLPPLVDALMQYSIYRGRGRGRSRSRGSDRGRDRDRSRDRGKDRGRGRDRDRR